jgi:HAD superfamily hydrolase (TIGR01509 family)
MLRGMLLDIDGTLLLSNDAHAQAWVDAFKEFDRDVPFEKIQPLIGMGGDKLVATLAPDLDESEGLGKQITDRRKKIFLEKYAPTLQPAPGGRDLLVHLRDLGLTLTIATSAKNEELAILLKAAQIEDLIHETTTSDDADESKPEPDIVEAALERAGLQADEVLMLGDTPYDVEAAGKAGVGAVVVRCGGHDKDLGDALGVYDTPADLLERFNDSPIAGRLERFVGSPRVS